MKPEVELRFSLGAAQDSRAQHLDELRRLGVAHAHLSTRHIALFRYGTSSDANRQREQNALKEELQQSQDSILVCQKQLHFLQFQVDDLLAQLDERYWTFKSQISSKTLRDARHPKENLDWARLAYGRAVKRSADARSEQWYHGSAEEAFRKVWAHERQRDQSSSFTFAFHRRYLRARSAKEIADRAFREREQELMATSSWYADAEQLRRAWVEQQQRHQEQRRARTASGFEQEHSRKYDRQVPRQPRANAQPRQTAAELRAQKMSQWRQDVEAAFANYPAMASFPTPPETGCSDIKCRSRTDRALQICDCSIRSAFDSLGNLKVGRTRWHPDRFGACSEEHHERYKKQAQEVFVVISALYEKQKMS